MRFLADISMQRSKKHKEVMPSFFKYNGLNKILSEEYCGSVDGVLSLKLSGR